MGAGNVDITKMATSPSLIICTVYWTLLFSLQYIMETQSYVNEMQTLSGTSQAQQHQPSQTTIIEAQAASAHSIQPTSHALLPGQQFLQVAS